MDAPGAMRTMRWLGTLLIGSFLIAPTAARADEPPSDGGEEAPKAPLQITIDRSKVDLEGHRLEVKLSRKAGHVTIKVYDELGAPLADEDHDFSGQPAGKPLRVSWTPSSGDKAARIEIFGYDALGYYKGVAIVPWSLSVPHEEVNFETNSAAIRPSETEKLEQSLVEIKKALQEHEDIGKITLFIAGHTDRVGSASHNLDLSRRRARSIAAWFRTRGLKVPIAYEGFGEYSPLVKTEDEVEEPRNRRADYVLAVEEPRFKTTGRPAAWKKL